MKFSLALGMIFVVAPAFAQEAPELLTAVEPASVALPCVQPPVAPPPVASPMGFGDVHEAIATMRAVMADLAQPTAVSAVANAFVQHWDLVIADHLAQQETTMTAMIDGTLGQNGEAIDEFLAMPPMDPGPSLFVDHEFQVAVAPFAQVGGFFAP